MDLSIVSHKIGYSKRALINNYFFFKISNFVLFSISFFAFVFAIIIYCFWDSFKFEILKREI